MVLFSLLLSDWYGSKKIPMVGKVWINMIGNKKADCGDAISLLCVDLFVVMRLWLLFQLPLFRPLQRASW